MRYTFKLFVFLQCFLLSIPVAAQQNSTEIVYLSGKGKDDTVLWDFYCSKGNNSKQWTSIAVPSCWEQQGFGNYNYGQDPIDNRHDEYGLYKHDFAVPKSWQNKEIRIVFEGVMTDATVKINGRQVGEKHQGAFYEFKYDISKYLIYGKRNLLEVRVDKVSSNESINHAERKADYWVFGGIFRPVYLEVLPKNYIDRLAIDSKANGKLLADVYINAPKCADVALHLTEIDGTMHNEMSIAAKKALKGKWRIEANASNIKPWNAEHPTLYVLHVSILDKKGNTLHTTSQRIGFRTVEVRESDGIYVNGQRIKFKGVNRHSFYPDSGRTTSKALSIEHVKMMKDMNMNAVRMSHYPPDKHFLEVCDSLGLFVIDEVCTWHSPSLDTVVGRKIVRETVVRDVNHPSILLWANGNESGWNTDLDDDYNKWDIQQREVIHPWNIFRKTNTLHYTRYHGLTTDGPATDKVFFPTEFLHGLYDGGHGAGLEDYWNKMWHMPLSAGGFLWVFADEGIVRTDKNGIIDTDGNHASDGILGPYGEKEASYYTIKEIWSPIHIEKRFIRPDFNGIFQVENRFHFTSLNACKMSASWVRFNDPNTNEKTRVMHQQNVQLPALNPHQKGAFAVELPEKWANADALILEAHDPMGAHIFTWSYPVKSPKSLNASVIAKQNANANNDPLKVTQLNDEIKVTSKNVAYTFSKSNGKLKHVHKNGKTIPLTNGPVILAHKDPVESVVVKEEKNRVIITATYKLTDKFKGWHSHVVKSSDIIQWTIYNNGFVDMHVEIKGKKIVKGYKGISFSFPEAQVSGMKWLGDGPYRVWRNRMKGTAFNVWENDYNNTITGESEFKYPEFKGFFSNLYWAKIKGKDNNGFTVYCHNPFMFLRMLTPENPKKDPKENVNINFPKGDISFLKNIPPIGTKFQKPETMGPQGNPENYFGNDDDPIVFDLTFQF